MSHLSRVEVWKPRVTEAHARAARIEAKAARLGHSSLSAGPHATSADGTTMVLVQGRRVAFSHAFLISEFARGCPKEPSKWGRLSSSPLPTHIDRWNRPQRLSSGPI